MLAQDYPPDLIEILVADGGSTDGTRDIVARLAAEDRRVVLVDNPRRLQAAGMNEAIRRARGDVIVRMDVHCEYARDYVRKCVEVLERTGADNVGRRPARQGELHVPASAVRGARQPARGRRSQLPLVGPEGFVDTVFLGAFPRRVFEKVGLYDPGAVTNEDAELNQRILDAGGRVYLSREIVVHYYPRDSFRALARQYFRYGRGRARTLAQAREVPLAAAGHPGGDGRGGIALLATAPLQPVPRSSSAPSRR